MVNPRKAYPIDPGLIPIYERGGRDNLGQEERGEGSEKKRRRPPQSGESGARDQSHP